ncbi:OmpC Outer membrane protein (porin) [Oxalobacteraceae bacterium]
MRKTQLALAAVALIASSAAMSANVSISGNLDVGIGRTSGYNGTGGMYLEQAAYFDNQSLSLNVNEDLGSGLKAHGSLGMGFNANGASDNPGANRDGNGTLATNASIMGNGLFNRQSYVGLSGEFGDIRLGRQLSPFIAAAAGNMHYVGMFGVGRLAIAGDHNVAAGVAAGSTAGGFFRDDAIQYTTPSMSGFTGNVMVTMRNSTTNNAYVIDRGRYSAFSLSGPLGPVTINAAYHAQAFRTAQGDKYTGYAIGGMMPITDGISVSAGYISTKTGNGTGAGQGTSAIAANNVRDDNRTDSYNLGIGFDLSQATKLLANYASSNVVANQSTTLMNVMLVNSLSARTKVYGGLGYGNRVGASIGTLGAVLGAGTVGAVANSPVNNNGVAGSNNAIVFGVTHSF